MVTGVVPFFHFGRVKGSTFPPVVEVPRNLTIHVFALFGFQCCCNQQFLRIGVLGKTRTRLIGVIKHADHLPSPPGTYSPGGLGSITPSLSTGFHQCACSARTPPYGLAVLSNATVGVAWCLVRVVPCSGGELLLRGTIVNGTKFCS